MKIELDIRTISEAMGIRKDTRHFEFVEHYGGDAREVRLPRWMNDRLLEVLAEEKERLERSKTSGDRAEQLAWAMIVLLAGQLIGGSKYAEFYVLGGAALLYLLLSTMQSVWQSVTIWLVKCRIKRMGIVLNDYPDWVSFGAWVFYWLKMIVIAIGAIYGASHFISFAM